MLSKTKKNIKNLLSKSLYFVPDKPYNYLTFYLKHGRTPNLSNPELFNDKLLRLKTTVRNPNHKYLVDKFEVRSHVQKVIGEEFLIPLIGVYNDPSEVDFETLPNQFALKPTSGAQNNLICKDKRSLNWEEASLEIKKWMSLNPYKRTREWQYKDIPNRFVIEEFITDTHGKTDDFKFWCFNGDAKIVQVDTDRSSNHKRVFHKVDDFSEMDMLITHEKPNYKVPKPANFDLMVNLANKLSKGFPFLRVDLYNIDGKIYFGELTFYPGNCNEKISSIEYEKKLGKELSLEN